MSQILIETRSQLVSRPRKEPPVALNPANITPIRRTDLQDALQETDLAAIDVLLATIAKAIDDGAAPRDLAALSRRMEQLIILRADLRAAEDAKRIGDPVPGRPRAFIAGVGDDE